MLKAATAFFFTFVEKKLLLPGQVENWIMIIDLNDVSMVSLPVKKVQAISNMAQSHYSGRLFRQFVINMSFMMRKSSSIFLNLADDATKR